MTEIERLRETRDWLQQRVSELHTVIEKQELEIRHLKRKIRELSN